MKKPGSRKVSEALMKSHKVGDSPQSAARQRVKEINLKKPRSVVIVDDDALMRQMLRLLLQNENYTVLGEGSNGVDAIYLCEKLKPDLALLDINMPAMDGLSALEEIRRMNPSIKVLIVSVEAKKDKVDDAIKKGVCGFVVKPLNAANVMDRIRNCFKEM